MGHFPDTIAAIATPQGRGGIGVIRVTGAKVETIAADLLGQSPRPREALFTSFIGAQGEMLDQGIALYFPAPKSFTGESVLELHAHGNPVLLDMILTRLFELGCRPARPGEFSERAFLNQKIDLAQAEAIADLIEAETSRGVRAASRSLKGEFSERIEHLVESTIALRLHVESAIDFSDEDISFINSPGIENRLSEIKGDLQKLFAASKRGTLLREGMTLVLAGKPNAGKSSLLNRLAGSERAIVTEIPGTTRDLLQERIELEGIPLNVIDTAGLRNQTDDPIEQEGIRRALAAIKDADQVLILVDDRYPEDLEEILKDLPRRMSPLIVRNKIDLSGQSPGLRTTPQGTEIRLSMKTGEGFEHLVRALRSNTLEESLSEGDYMARRRHLEALSLALQEFQEGQKALKDQQLVFVAEHLRAAQLRLSEITGSFSSDDLLGRIFSTFCIGK